MVAASMGEMYAAEHLNRSEELRPNNKRGYSSQLASVSQQGRSVPSLDSIVAPMG